MNGHVKEDINEFENHSVDSPVKAKSTSETKNDSLEAIPTKNSSLNKIQVPSIQDINFGLRMPRIPFVSNFIKKVLLNLKYTFRNFSLGKFILNFIIGIILITLLYLVWAGEVFGFNNMGFFKSLMYKYVCSGILFAVMAYMKNRPILKWFMVGPGITFLTVGIGGILLYTLLLIIPKLKEDEF